MATTQIKNSVQKFKSTIATAIAAALGLTIALFWQDAVKSFINEVLVKLPLGSGWIFSLIAAIIVTILCSIGIWLIAKWQR